MDALTKDSKWTRRHCIQPVESSAKTVLIIHFEWIGSRTAKRCDAFDMIELIHCHYINHNQVRSAGYESVPDLEAALPPG